MKDNIHKFPSKKDNVRDLFDQFLNEGIDQAVVIGMKDGKLEFGFTDFDNIHALNSLIEVLKDIVMDQVYYEFFGEDE